MPLPSTTAPASRVRTQWLWWPLTLQGCTRWLCWARVLEQRLPAVWLVHFDSLPAEWVPVAWVTD
jgi:hypothetical protein